MWRGGGRSNISVAAPFVWRCLTGSAMAPFPHPAHRTGQADLPHPALGQDVTPSPTTGRDQAGSGVRARSARKGAGVDRPLPAQAEKICHGIIAQGDSSQLSCYALLAEMAVAEGR